ncbi:MAG: diphthamide synthesis protein [Nitrososphaerota archaeon]|nr:diphthamide synthesis protein [Nitrososphaerota archaeon]MDG6977533.1 diphthamide synthesis protein [Nitrososphaerota archaeon]MDG7006184.1 diphthamide synthesis protein [Nitrososphaerota archaeon]MDG7020599.1 diphthamide synthesis protein [Nitrososphaerota archaeon]MDG7022049.1 diphthamide synthesis protein [Nitrososphaerota archaeon]
MTVKIDTDRVFRLIEEKRPTRVIINAPGGLLRQTMELMRLVEQKYGTQCVLVGDSCFGICDTVDEEVEKLGASIALHIGHNASVDRVGDHTYLVDAKDDIKFDSVVARSIPLLAKYKRVGLATFSQHLDELEPVRRQLEDAGFEVHLGRKNNLLLGSQTFGCDFSTVFENSDKVDAFCYLGQSEFHAVGVALATGKPTFLLDPYLEEMRDMREEAEERQKRAILSVYKALDATVFGVVTGLKEGQMMLGRSKWITSRLQAHGKKVVQLAMRDITPDRLAPFTGIEAFVQTACPRISIDGFTFGKPVLSIPQADALVALLEGRSMNEFLRRPKWIELTVGQIPRK